jgi:hypothetical protein
MRHLITFIADRMGQFASGTAPDMLSQAETLFALYDDTDLEYLNRRIRQETLGECDVSNFNAKN